MTSKLLRALGNLEPRKLTATEELTCALGLDPQPGVTYRVRIDRAVQVDLARRLSAMVEGGVVEVRSVTVMPSSGELRIGICMVKK